jgi:hypothetical protein
MPITCWYSGTAFIPLLQASSVEVFSKEATEGLEVLDRTVEQLQKMWGTADIIRNGFKRLRSMTRHESSKEILDQNTAGHIDYAHSSGYSQLTLNEAIQSPPDSFNWIQLFPFVTRSTNKIADMLLANSAQDDLEAQMAPLFDEDMWNQYQDLLHPFTDHTLDFMGGNFV